MITPAPLPPSSPLKRWLDANVPYLYRPLRGAVQGLKDWRFRQRYARLTRDVTDRFGWDVQAGPFAGMKYTRQSFDSVLLPKLLGTYELELQPVIEAAIGRAYPTIVDIGTAEGYYAVGMALRSPSAKVLAFEANPTARAQCGKLAALNGVADRIEIRDAFRPGDAANLAGQRTFVICDVDGYETEIFAPTQAACWTKADLLVELHDFLGLPCRDSVVEPLRATHTPTFFECMPRAAEASARTAHLPLGDRLLAVDEIRPKHQWVYLEAKPLGIAMRGG
jgi:hypothetical protein